MYFTYVNIYKDFGSHYFMEKYNKIMKEGGYKILNKIAYKITNNAVEFINNITTNDMDKSNNAFIDRLGRLIALVDQKVIDKNTIILVLEEKYEQKFLENLNFYIRFTKSRVEKLNYKVIHIINLNIEGIKINKEVGYLLLLDNL